MTVSPQVRWSATAEATDRSPGRLRPTLWGFTHGAGSSRATVPVFGPFVALGPAAALLAYAAPISGVTGSPNPLPRQDRWLPVEALLMRLVAMASEPHLVSMRTDCPAPRFVGEVPSGSESVAVS